MSEVKLVNIKPAVRIIVSVIKMNRKKIKTQWKKKQCKQCTYSPYTVHCQHQQHCNLLTDNEWDAILGFPCKIYPISFLEIPSFLGVVYHALHQRCHPPAESVRIPAALRQQPRRPTTFGPRACFAHSPVECLGTFSCEALHH